MAKRAFVILIAMMLAGTASATELDDATAAYSHGDYVTALMLLQPLADGGDRAAQHNLGTFYADGRGDYAEAGRWFHMAADQGFAEAQFNLGLMYAEGQGVPQDYRQSAIWYRRAAEQGHARAQLNLGAMYANGQGVLRNYIEAHKWFDVAVLNLPPSQSEFYDTAVYDRDLAARMMTPAEVAQAQKLAKAWKPNVVASHLQ